MALPTTNVTFGRDFFRPLRGSGGRGAIFPRLAPAQGGSKETVGYHLPPAAWAGGCSALLGFVVMLQSYDYFSSSVPFFQIPDGLRDLTQLVTLVDDRCYLSGLHDLVHDDQVLFARFRQKQDELLAHEP